MPPAALKFWILGLVWARFSGSVPVPLEQIICVEPDRKSRGTPVEKGCTVFE